MSESETTFRTVIILDDHPLLRKGVQELIETIDSELEIVSSGTLKDCSEILDIYKPALIVLDLNLPDSQGIDSLRAIAKITDAAILVYSLKDEDLVGPTCYKHGAKAYVMKEASSAHLEEAIIALLNGGTWCSPTLAAKLMSKVPETGTAGVENLSERELEVFELIGAGKSIKEIAFSLELSPKTIESHRDRIKAKLHVNNSTDLTIKARDWLTG